MSAAEYRVAVRDDFDALGPRVRRAAVARHDLLQTHLSEFAEVDR